MTTPDPGMDHDLYEFSPSVERAPIEWPGGRSVAVWVSLHFEAWEVCPARGHRRDPEVHGPWGTIAPDTRTASYRAYGDRVGVFRVLEAIDAADVPLTAVIGSAAVNPRILVELVARDAEIAAGGTHATRIVASHLSEDAEATMIEESLSALADFTGIRPTGWMGPSQSESVRTLDLLAARGIEWISDWPNDDRPYRMNSGIVSLPQHPDLSDLRLLWVRQQPTWDLPMAVAAAIEVLRAEMGAAINLTIHPWLLGQPHRITYLESLLEDLAANESIWLTTAGQIVAHFNETEQTNDSH